MDFNEILQSITPEIYENLKRSIELGKWPDGRKLTEEQKSSCIQAVIAYEHEHVKPEARTGYVPPKNHDHCDGDGDVAEPEDKPLKWR